MFLELVKNHERSNDRISMRQAVEENKVVIAAVLVIGLLGAVAATQTDIVESVTGSSGDHSGDAMQAQGDAMKAQGDAMEAEGEAMDSNEDAMESSGDAMDSEDSMNDSIEQ